MHARHLLSGRRFQFERRRKDAYHHEALRVRHCVAHEKIRALFPRVGAFAQLIEHVPLHLLGVAAARCVLLATQDVDLPISDRAVVSGTRRIVANKLNEIFDWDELELFQL